MKKEAAAEMKDQDLDTLASVSPDGERFVLPVEDDYAAENRRLEALVAEQRALGREIVVVMGVGFVGAVMAGVVADAVDKRTGEPLYFVIGMQRPSPRSYWKIPYLNRGVAPVEAEDPEVAPLIARCVNDKKTLTASFSYEALTLADVVVVDVQCDYNKNDLGNVRDGHADIKALEDSLKIIGEKIAPHCLVLIETTVPPGTTEYVAYPILKKAFEARGLKIHHKDTEITEKNLIPATRNPEPGTRRRRGAAFGPQLRTGDARAPLRGIDPRLLAGVLRGQRRGPRQGGALSGQRAQRGKIPPHRVGSAHRE
jgi:hypothetical protein